MGRFSKNHKARAAHTISSGRSVTSDPSAYTETRSQTTTSSSGTTGRKRKRRLPPTPFSSLFNSGPRNKPSSSPAASAVLSAVATEESSIAETVATEPSASKKKNVFTLFQSRRKVNSKAKKPISEKMAPEAQQRRQVSPEEHRQWPLQIQQSETGASKEPSVVMSIDPPDLPELPATKPDSTVDEGSEEDPSASSSSVQRSHLTMPPIEEEDTPDRSRSPSIVEDSATEKEPTEGPSPESDNPPQALGMTIEVPDTNDATSEETPKTPRMRVFFRGLSLQTLGVLAAALGLLLLLAIPPIAHACKVIYGYYKFSVDTTVHTYVVVTKRSAQLAWILYRVGQISVVVGGLLSWSTILQKTFQPNAVTRRKDTDRKAKKRAAEPNSLVLPFLPVDSEATPVAESTTEEQVTKHGSSDSIGPSSIAETEGMIETEDGETEKGAWGVVGWIQGQFADREADSTASLPDESPSREGLIEAEDQASYNSPPQRNLREELRLLENLDTTTSFTDDSIEQYYDTESTNSFDSAPSKSTQATNENSQIAQSLDSGTCESPPQLLPTLDIESTGDNVDSQFVFPEPLETSK